MPILTLRNVKTQEYYDILWREIHLIGRAGFGADLEISDDSSISRCHANLTLVKKSSGNLMKLFLILVDKQSKYGTFINNLDEPIESNRPKILKIGDKIRFGVMDSNWTVEEYTLVVCPSTLKTYEKDELKNMITSFGGRVERNWSEECTHLCMNSVTVTEKVLLCLASAKSIVTVQYFIELMRGLNPHSLSKVPACIDYKPQLAESLLNPNSLSLDVNNKRKTLFSGKTFICSTVNQLNRLSKLVKLTGGEIMSYSAGMLSDNDILSSTKYILMQRDPQTEEDNHLYQRILEKLKMVNKRSIPENDIGFAIIFSNTTKHCNPSFNVSLVNLESQSNSIKSQESIVLASETEVLTVNNSELLSVNTIPDSLPNTIPDSSPNTIPDSLPNTISDSPLNTIPDSLPNTGGAFKRPFEVVFDSEEIIQPINKRFLLANGEGENNSKETIRIENECEIEPTPSCSNHNVQSPIPKTQTVDTNDNLSLTTVSSSHCISNTNKSSLMFEPTPSSGNQNMQSPTPKNQTVTTNDNLGLTTVSNSQHISNRNKLSAWLQSTVADNNVNNTNNLQSKTAENLAVPSKRKIANDNPVFNNENEDPFNYMDIDEVEEHPKKKPRNGDMNSIFFPMTDTSSSNKSEPSKTVETNANVAVDPNFIMNLLSEAKGTGQFIDASIPHNKSSDNTNEDTKYDSLLNSVIVETVSMVVSRPTQTANIIQGNNSNLQNFKKFKKKGPTMRIPHIVPMEFIQID